MNVTIWLDGVFQAVVNIEHLPAVGDSITFTTLVGCSKNYEPIRKEAKVVHRSWSLIPDRAPRCDLIVKELP